LLIEYCRTIALNFSAALDDLFKLNGIGALEESVEQKYGFPHPLLGRNPTEGHPSMSILSYAALGSKWRYADKPSVNCRKGNVLSQRFELEDLETRLRETETKLKRLEANHRRHQSHQIFTQRKPVAASDFVPPGNEIEEDSSGDSDAQQGRSPQQYRGEENR
jgi:hypothetical protein